MPNYTLTTHNDGILPVSFENGTTADITVPYLAMKIKTSADNLVELAGAGDNTLFVGIAQDVVPLKLGEHIAVKAQGFTGAIAGGTVTKGALLKLAAGGKLVATTTTGDVVVAQCLSAGVLNDYIEVRLFGSLVTI